LKTRAKARKLQRLTGAKSPIPAQIKDTGEYKNFFATYKDVFIPYAGTVNSTSQSLLNFLLSLSELSPTKGSIIRAKYLFSLSGKMRIQRNLDFNFDFEGDTDPGEDQKRSFIETLRDRIKLFGSDGRELTIKDFVKVRQRHLEACGNFYFFVSRSELLGDRRIEYRIIEPDECLYLITPEGDPKILATSKYWSLDYIRRNPPRLTPVYPNFAPDDTGVERSIVHEKTDGRWYGRPEDINSMLYQFLEFQNVDYLNTETKSRFTGQVFIEVEEADPNTIISDEESQESGFDSFADELHENFSNKTDDPLTIMVTSRPYGARHALVEQFRPNTSQDWYKVTNEEAERQILKSHNWPRKLLGLAEASGLSTNEFKDVFEVASATTIKEIQESAGHCINELVIRPAFEFLGITDFNDLAIEFTSPFREMLIEREEAEQEINETTPQGNGNTQDTNNE